jgi:glutamate decarboxylase
MLTHQTTTSPDYPLPPSLESVEILRVVVRESMSVNLLDMLIGDILSTTEALMASDVADSSTFAHPSQPRIEKYVQSMGEHGTKHHGAKGGKGVLRTTC